MAREKKLNRINPTMLTGNNDKHPFRPTRNLVCGPQGATRLAWNDSGCWLETRADQTLLDHDTESFAGELLAPLQAAELADVVSNVARSMKPSKRTLNVRTPGKFHKVVKLDGLVAVGTSRNWAVLVTDADGVSWFRTCGMPMDREQLRTLAIQLRAWARAENKMQELLEMGYDSAIAKKLTRRDQADQEA